MSFSKQEIDDFKAESLELLDNAEKSLLALDHGSDFRQAFDAIFRCFHNLKGGAGMMDLRLLQEHTHRLEDILMQFQAASSLPKPYINLFLRGIDACKSLLEGVEVDFDFSANGNEEKTAGKAPKPSELPKLHVPEKTPASKPNTPNEAMNEALNEFLGECDEIIERVSNSLAALDAATHTKIQIDELYRDIHSLKGSAFLFSFHQLGELAHSMESSLEAVRNGTHSPSKPLIDALFKGLELIEQHLQSIRSRSGEHSFDNTPSNDVAAQLPPAASPATQSPASPAAPCDARQPQSAVKDKDSEAATSIRVPVSLLDNLMNLMGEMVLVRNQVLQFSNRTENPEFLSMSKRLNVVTSEIQGEMMKTRMQPIGNILGKFNRVVRDLSNELGKSINLELSGAETEVDKSLLEAIKDPLTHIVRNSCDHGIESPELRRKAGKPETGNIRIKAYHEGGQVMIEVNDDGKGLNKDVLISKAIEKGLLTKSDAAKLNEKDTFNLIFAPGFSTASKITNVSGRGVGMDVVRANIEKIGGTVELSSMTGSGMTTKIKIPLTLAIVPALIAKSGPGIFAIPQVKLEELVRIDPQGNGNRIETLHGHPVLRLRGNILPLADLQQVLRGGGFADYATKVVNIAVLNADQFSFGLIIDQIIDTADIVVKPLNRLLKSLQIYSGATILGDGGVALILDVPGLCKVARIANTKAVSQSSSEKTAQEKQSLAQESQDYLLVKVGSQTKHAIVLGYVHRLEEFKKESIEYSGSKPVIRYGQHILPLITVHAALGYPPAKETREKLSVVVIKRAGQLYGLLVDDILDTLSTAADLESNHTKQLGIFGSLNTADELIVVIDPFELIELSYPSTSAEGAGSPPAGPRSGPPRPRTEPKAFIPARILLVEDTTFFRKTIQKLLEKAGHRIVTANDGREAIDILNQSPDFDLIISDIEMPRVNGFELAETLKRHPSFSNIPLLAVSARADADFFERGAKAGFDRYLEKLKPEILLDAVSELGAKKRRIA